MSNQFTSFFLIIGLTLFTEVAVIAQNFDWHRLEAEGQVHERHENALVRAGDKIILLGGRGIKPIDIYDVTSKTWTTGATPPFEAHHMQAISLNGLVYVVGAFTGSWPYETPISHILIYDPEIDLWAIGPEIPAHRRRGAAGVVTYDNKIYVVCGIINGHTSGWVNWLDEYDPATNKWRQLPDAPKERDHLHTAVIGDKLYVAAGRRSGDKGGFAATVKETNVYDFKAQKWAELPSPEGDIPTKRAGAAAAVHKGNLLIMGGESGSQEASHSEVEMLNVTSGKWSALAPLKRGRHGTQAIYFDDMVIIGAGSGNRGGGPELTSFEVFAPESSPTIKSTPIVKGELVSSKETVVFNKPKKGSKQIIEVENKGGNQALLVSYSLLDNTGDYEIQMPSTTPLILSPGGKLSIEVVYKGNGSQEKPANLIIKTIGKSAPLVVPVSVSR